MRSSPSRPVVVALIVACALFMQTLDGTIIATALPQMAVSFETSPIYVSIGITAYILTVAVFIPISGWVADHFGTRTVFRGAIGIFTLGSILCGLSGGLWEFTAARVLQGIGGAMMLPVGQLIVLRMTPKENLVRSVNIYTVPGLIGPVIGPPLGGFITTYASWHWIFFLNLPIGLVGMVLVSIFIENHRSGERRPLDGAGFLLTGTALVCLMYGLELAGHREADWLLPVALIGGGVALGWIAIRHAMRHPHPLLDLSPLRIRTCGLAIGGGALFRVTIGSVAFFLPLMFQVSLSMTAFISGMLILAHAAADLSMKAVTRRILRTFGFRAVLTWNGMLTAGAMVLFGFFWDTTPIIVMVAVLVLTGALRSMQFTGLNTLAYADVPRAKMSAATSLAGMVQQVSIGTGVAVGAILLQAALALRGAPADAVLRVGDFRLAFIVVAVMTLISALSFTRLELAAGAEVSGHRRPSPAEADAE